MTHRILHVISSLDRAGPQKSLAQLATGLPASEFDVHVCALSAGGPVEGDLRAANIPVTVLGQRFSLDPFVYWQLQKLIRQLQPDVVQTWDFAANTHGRAAARSVGVKHVVGVESCVDPWRPLHHLAIDRRLARRTSKLVVPTAAVREFYISKGIAAEKVITIAGGVEPDNQAAGDVPTDSASRAALLDELGLPLDARLIGAVGSLTPRKRLRDPLWATDLLKVIRDDVHFLIIGDGPERTSLLRFRDNVEIRDRVHLLGHREDVPRLLAHLDLLWHASGYEGLPYAVMEAMAAGLPVVATDIPGNRELVMPEETGFLVPIGNRAALARKANTLLDDDELRARMGEAGRARVQAQFPTAMMLDAYVALYRDLLSQ